MAEIYPLGKNRIFYRTRTLPVPGVVIVNLIDPNLKNDISIELIGVEIVSGLFYFEAIFSLEGTYIAIFYEDGKEKIAQSFSTRKLPAVVEEIGRFRSFRGNNVING